MSNAFACRGLRISVVAVLNDTTGTLMSCAYRDPATRIGLILGTGTNACYVERVKNVEAVEEAGSGGCEEEEEGSMVVNTEWGAFGEAGELDLLSTAWDKTLDAKTENPGQQIFEKMVSGMYLGELVRIILVDLVSRGLLLPGQEIVTLKLYRPGCFTTKHLCEVRIEKSKGKPYVKISYE